MTTLFINGFFVVDDVFIHYRRRTKTHNMMKVIVFNREIKIGITFVVLYEFPLSGHNTKVRIPYVIHKFSILQSCCEIC